MGSAGRFASGPRSIIDIESHPVRTAAKPSFGSGSSSGSDLRSRLTELMGEQTPEQLAQRLSEFKRSVHQTLIASSSAFAILDQLADSGLKDCAKCTHELQSRLATNPHYLVLGKLQEAEQLLAQIGDRSR
jgi:hypothetical protein